MLTGDAGEVHSRRHALSNNQQARAQQKRFITFAARDMKRLRFVLLESSDAHHRALAAEIMAYAASKQEIVKDLVFGMNDPAEGVRSNAMRELSVITGFAHNSPVQRIKVLAQPFVEMLNFVE